MNTVIDSQGDYHDISLRITSVSVELSGGIDQTAAFDAAVEASGGNRNSNSIEANVRYSNIVADTLKDIVSAVVAAGITDGEPEYEEHDSYCETRIRLADGRRLQLVAHYYDGNFDAHFEEE